MKTKKKSKLINHVAYLVDASGSMGGLTSKIREVMQNKLDNLAANAKATGIETRVSIFHFGDELRCVSFDVPTEDLNYPRYCYSASMGGTALIDSIGGVLDRLAEIDTSKGDHSFLFETITDGAETKNTQGGQKLNKRLLALNDDYTVAVLVPDAHCAHNAKMYGFPSGNIEIWATTEVGMEEVSVKSMAATTAYFAGRTAGVKSTKQLFKFDAITKKDVVKTLDVVNPGEYETLIVRKYHDGWEIKTFVEDVTKRPYRVGSSYYQVTKKEIIQASKTLAVVEKSTGRMFSGPNARKVLGLPNTDVKVEPADFKLFDLFVQSMSTNRHLVANTLLIVFK